MRGGSERAVVDERRVRWAESLISKLLKGTRIGAAAVLPALIMFGVASDDIGGYDGTWVIDLAPVALIAVVAVGCLDGLRGVVLTALCCGVIFAVAAHVERDDRPLPGCGTLMDFGCKNDANPRGGFAAAILVLVGGGAAALIASPIKKRSPSG